MTDVPNSIRADRSLTRRALLLKVAAAGAAAGTAPALLAACTSTSPQGTVPSASGGTAPTTSSPKTLVIGHSIDPDTLDTHRTASFFFATTFANDSILSRDFTGKPVPSLAESWNISDDGKVWTLKLRQGVKFHTGAPFNASALKATIDDITSDETKSPVKGFLLGTLTDAATVDDYTLRLTFKDPYPPFWDTLTQPWLGPYDPAVLQRDPAKFGEHPVTTGMYKFVEWTRGTQIKFARNPDYTTIRPDVTNKGPAKYDSVVIRVIPDAETRLLEFERGNVQVLPFLHFPESGVKRFKGNKDFVLLPDPPDGLDFIAFNNDKWPFTERPVRAAISMAIDRAPLVAGPIEGLGTAVYGPIPPGTPGFSQPIEDSAKTAYPFDVARAKQTLVSAGYSAGPDGAMRKSDGRSLNLTILVRSDAAYVNSTAQILQSQLQQIGVVIKIQLMDFAALKAACADGKFDMAMFRYGGKDPGILNFYFTRGANPITHFATPELDRLLAAGQTIDEARRKATYEQAQRLLVDAQPWVPLFTRTQYNAVRAEVTGAKVHPILGGLILNDLGT